MRISDWSSDVCSSDLSQRCPSARRGAPASTPPPSTPPTSPSGSTPTAVPRISASGGLASVLGRARGPAQRRGSRTRTKQRRPWWHCLVVARRDARMLARKAAARTRRAERRKRWTIWDGIAQWGAPTLGSLAFMMTTGFLLLGAGGIVAGGVGALVGLVLWLTLLVGIAATGGPQQTWRRFRQIGRAHV